MVDGKKVSIIVPTRDRPGILVDTIKAIDKIDYPKEKYEVIIIIDKYVSNTTEEVLTSLKNELTVNISYYRNEKTFGHSRNLGINHAKYPFIGFLDDDTKPEKDWIKKMLSVFKEDNVGIAYGKTITPQQLIYPWRLSPAGHKGATCNIMYRKEALNSVNNLDTTIDFYNDIVLEQDVLKKGYIGIESGAEGVHDVEILNAAGIIKKFSRHTNDAYLYKTYPNAPDRFSGKPFQRLVGPFSMVGISSIVTFFVLPILLYFLGIFKIVFVVLVCYIALFLIFILKGYKKCLLNKVRAITLAERVKTFFYLNLCIPIYMIARIRGSIMFKKLIF